MISEIIKIFNYYKSYRIIKKSGLFDPNYYFNTYPEIKNRISGPIIHYLKSGWHEGKNPSNSFDTNFYLNHYRDVSQSGINPLVHYILFGNNEQRAPNKDALDTPTNYGLWIESFDNLNEKEISQIKSHIPKFDHKPTVSIFLALGNDSKDDLSISLKSIQNQLYKNWELFILNTRDSSNTQQILSDYSTQDPRIKYLYKSQNESISAMLNYGISICSGDYVSFLEHPVELSIHALYLVINQINQSPDSVIFYTDEDFLDANYKRVSPYFKPDWNPDLFLSQDYISQFCVFQKIQVERVNGIFKDLESQLTYNLALQISENISASLIKHIPFVCCHSVEEWQETETPEEKNKIRLQTHSQLLENHFKRLHQDVDIAFNSDSSWQIKFSIPNPEPTVSIIIPTKNKKQQLLNCIKSIKDKTTYSNYEVIIVNNENDEPISSILSSSYDSRSLNIKFLEYFKPFNFSAINNIAAHNADGSILIFLNDDTVVITPEWIEGLISHALRDNIGAVGAMLYFPNETIQHAGVILGIKGVAGHVYYKNPRGFQGQKGRAHLMQNYSAVTAACMAIEKQKFLEIGGFNEIDLPIAYNDVDLCLRLINAGYRNLWTPFVELYHYESSTRLSEDTLEKKMQLNSEFDYMINKWGNLLLYDPAYNPNLSLDRYPFSLAFPPRVKKPWESKISS